MMGFATIGLWLFYFAFRYNLLFVNNCDIDTKGMVYPKALNHTLVGCYLSVICMIGLLAIRAAAGPIVLMVVLLVFMVLYHVSYLSAIQPLLYYLPHSLVAEEASLLRPAEAGVASASNGHAQEKNSVSTEGEIPSDKAALGATSQGKPSMIKKFLRPDIYDDYATMRKLVPQDTSYIRYEPEVEQNAYQHPAVIDTPPLLWVPRDSMGVSKQECAHTSKVTPMTDEGASFDDKGKIIWDMDGTDGRPPVYAEKIYY
jgi:calcium permeable stress-gated cation channel